MIGFLCADTKNSVGLVGCIEEVAHNAISIYWNPLESSAKVTIFVHPTGCSPMAISLPTAHQ
jgi:hypothetical protein